ncbi:hypothetical protein [Undibacterium sp. Ren11W]|uniref:hypothetical protein n=1 Tax=Undibacterium sp. Ren11W TaxID=3413045 RepID=UPI003BEF5C41
MESLFSPATIATGGAGSVVHVVRCDEAQIKAGIARQVYSLCGRTHDKNDGWALCPDAPVTCPKCRKKWGK